MKRLARLRQAIREIGLALLRSLAKPVAGRRRQRGQSIVEYILVLCAVVGGILFVMGQLKSSNFFYKKFTAPLVKHIVYNYKYGDPSAQGWDEGTPRNHIQIQEPKGSTFRLF
ncbi:MAG: hypothetical protein EOP11_08685, partial [Proteobacteria bacterium]